MAYQWFRLYSCVPGGEALGGGTDGLGSGGLVATGEGCIGTTSIDCVGEGNGRFFRVFEFSFALSFVFRFTLPASPGVWPGEAELALSLAP